jgi:hypothetical protein
MDNFLGFFSVEFEVFEVPGCLDLEKMKTRKKDFSFIVQKSNKLTMGLFFV